MNAIRRIRTLRWIGLALLVVVAACNMGVGTFADKGSLPPPGGPVEPFTGARVSIPLISTRLLSAMNADYAPSARGLAAQAILFATSVNFELYANGDPEALQQWLISDEAGMTIIGDEGPPRLEAFLPIDAGSGYTLRATVYNSKVSLAEPVVEGVSAEFTITAGVSTPVSIVAIPANPVLFGSHGDSAGLSIAQTPYQFGDGGPNDPDLVFTDFGGEAWFQLDLSGASDRYVRFRADPGGQADVIMLVYDDQGRMIEGSNDPPAWSWGFFPTEIGGRGGTRGGIIGSLQEDITVYLGMVLASRDEFTASGSVDVTMDILERLFEDYANALPAGQEPPGVEDFHSLEPRTEITQIVFRADDQNGGGDNGGDDNGGDN
ncbi:MAG: hypothetical protein EA384_12565, partial [Spirochaetaceae bacterium]